MKKYKVESFLLYSKLTLDTNHILKDSTEKIQELLDKNSKEGWTLTSTDASKFGYAMYYYLYFEREV
ncbi:DUF4177 domain-containing protein [Maribacter algicola]|uniref:DUF4177 domain-containing protein n=1 Tax=Meishania litoralis TaxID=3434685 RepID=A0ACC7LMZ2_9FLAO